MDIRTLSAPLYRVKGWLKFVGVMLIIDGVLLAITFVGIVVAWIPIWLGVLCFQSAGAIENANHSDSEESMMRSLSKIATAIIIVGVVNLVGIAFVIVSIFIFGGIAGLMSMVAVSHFGITGEIDSIISVL